MYVGQIAVQRFCLPFEFVTYHVGGWLTRILDRSTIIRFENGQPTLVISFVMKLERKKHGVHGR